MLRKFFLFFIILFILSFRRSFLENYFYGAFFFLFLIPQLFLFCFFVPDTILSSSSFLFPSNFLYILLPRYFIVFFLSYPKYIHSICFSKGTFLSFFYALILSVFHSVCFNNLSIFILLLDPTSTILAINQYLRLT